MIELEKASSERKVQSKGEGAGSWGDCPECYYHNIKLWPWPCEDFCADWTTFPTELGHTITSLGSPISEDEHFQLQMQSCYHWTQWRTLQVLCWCRIDTWIKNEMHEHTCFPSKTGWQIAVLECVLASFFPSPAAVNYSSGLGLKGGVIYLLLFVFQWNVNNLLLIACANYVNSSSIPAHLVKPWREDVKQE